MVGDNEQPATEFMLYYLQELKKVSDKSKNLEELYKRITSQVINYHFGAIIGLHNTNLLSNFLELHAQKGGKMVQIAIIGYHNFFKHFNEYKTIFDAQNIKEIWKDDERKYEKYMGQNQQYQYLRDLLKRWFSLKFTENSMDEFIELNRFITEKVQSFRPKDGFEQIFIVWLRRQCEERQYKLHKSLKIDSDDLCCRLHFKSEEVLNDVNRHRNGFVAQTEKSKLVEKNSYYQVLLKKYIVAFLNESGGVINIGAKMDNKKIVVSGLSLKPEEKKEILSFIIDICLEIDPQKEGKKQDEDQASYLSRKKQVKKKMNKSIEKPLEEVEYEYSITDQVSVEFVPIYDSKVFLYSEGRGLELYLLKVKVRAGDPYEVYHFINDKDTPESTIREDNRNKELFFLEYYQLFYKRLKMKAEAQSKSQRLPQPKEESHSYCRFQRKSAIINKVNTKPIEIEQSPCKKG